MAIFLIDTNHLSAAASPDHPIRKRIKERALQGDRFVIIVPVLCELEAGIQRTRDLAGYRQELSGLFRYVRLWPLDEGMAITFGRLWIELKARGRVLSQVDVMLAALCVQRDAILLTSDRDFEAVPYVRVEDWRAGV